MTLAMKALIGGLIVVGVAFFALRRGGDIDGMKARQLVENGALLLDVRTRDEYAGSHIPGAVNIPVQELESRLKELTPKSRAVVVYCRSGMRSASAAAVLKREGYAEVYDLGGMGNW